MQVLDWHREQHNRAQLMAGIWDMLYKDLPETYEQELFWQECKLSYRYADDYRSGGRQSV